MRAHLFRFAPNCGHRLPDRACPKGAATSGHYVREPSTADVGVLAGQATGGGVAGAVLTAIDYERLISGAALQRPPGTLRLYNSGFQLVNGLVGAAKPSAQLAPETRK